MAATASTKPGCASEGDELDAGEPAGDEASEEGEPGGAVLGSDDVEAERLAEAVGVDGDRVDDAGIHRATSLAALDVERVEDEVGVGGAVARSGAEVLDDHVHRLREAGDLALRHALEAELLHELLHPAGGDAGQVGIRDHRHERLLGPPARREQPVGEVAALPQLGDRELDRADAGVPVTLAVAVADIDPLRRALTVGRAAERVRLRGHQRLRDLLHHRPPEIRARLLKLRNQA